MGSLINEGLVCEPGAMEGNSSPSEVLVSIVVGRASLVGGVHTKASSWLPIVCLVFIEETSRRVDI